MEPQTAAPSLPVPPPTIASSPKAGSPPAAAVYRDDYATNFSRSLAYRPPEALQMKREIKEMKPKLDSASKALDRTNSVLQQKTQELQRLRAEHEPLLKEVTKLRKLAASVNADNRRLSEELQATKDYCKKVESKLVYGSNGQYLLEQTVKLKDSVRLLRAENEEYAAVRGDLESRLKKAESDVHTLSKALEIRTESLGLGRPMDIRTSLLYEVAKYREEAKRLSIDLAESNRRIRELEESESVVQSQLDDVVAQRAIAADRAAAVETDYEDERNLRLQAEQELQQAQRQQQVATDYVKEQAEKISLLSSQIQQLEHQLDESRASEVSARVALQSLEAKLAQAKTVQDVTEHSLTEARAKQREADAAFQQQTGQILRARQLESEYKRHLEDANKVDHHFSGYEVKRMFERCEDLEQQLEQSAQDRDAAQERARELSVENGRLKDSVARLEASLQSIREEYDKARSQLQSHVATRESNADRIRDLSSKNATLTVENQQLKDQVSDLIDQVTHTKQAKALLQTTMVTQISHLRDQVARSKQSPSKALPSEGQTTELVTSPFTTAAVAATSSSLSSQRAAAVAAALVKESLRPTSEFVAVDKAGQQQHIYHSLRGQLSQGLLAEDDPGLTPAQAAAMRDLERRMAEVSGSGARYGEARTSKTSPHSLSALEASPGPLRVGGAVEWEDTVRRPWFTPAESRAKPGRPAITHDFLSPAADSPFQ